MHTLRSFLALAVVAVAAPIESTTQEASIMPGSGGFASPSLVNFTPRSGNGFIGIELSSSEKRQLSGCLSNTACRRDLEEREQAKQIGNVVQKLPAKREEAIESVQKLPAKTRREEVVEAYQKLPAKQRREEATEAEQKLPAKREEVTEVEQKLPAKREEIVEAVQKLPAKSKREEMTEAEQKLPAKKREEAAEMFQKLPVKEKRHLPECISNPVACGIVDPAPQRRQLRGCMGNSRC